MSNILVIIPYEFYPPRYGGALRCFHLLKENAKYHKVFLLTVQPSADFKAEVQPAFPENVTILSIQDEKKIRTVFNLLPPRYANAINSRIIQKNIFKKGNQLLLDTYSILKKLFSSEKIDYVIYENMQCFGGLYPHIKKMIPSVRHIYDTHNVDSELWKVQAAITGDVTLLQYSRSALSVESNLSDYVALCFCCSEKDKSFFDNLNNGRANVVTIPNGVDTIGKPFDLNPAKYKIPNILFCGGLDYAPNKEGMLWFADHVFPLVRKQQPDITFTVIGKMGQDSTYADLEGRDGILLRGQVPDVRPFYNACAVSIVPLLKGSGTRLKILEAMSMGTPVVSTTVGAEGIEAESGKEIMLADNAEDFAKAVGRLITNATLFDSIRTQARKLVEEKYDWAVIGKKMNEAIQKMSTA